MKNNIKYIIALFINVIILNNKNALAQSEDVMKFMPNIMQSNWNASANTTDSRITIGIPVVNNLSFSIYNTGFALNDLYTQKGDTAVIKLTDFVNGLKKENYFGVGFNTSLLAFQLNTKKMGIGFSINDRVAFRVTYPGDLAKFFRYGNGVSMGEAQNIGGFKFNVNYYRECAVHLQKKFGNLTIGVSPKLLFGQANIDTRKSNLSLLTDTSYFKITAESEMEIATSGIDTSFGTAIQNNWSNALFNTKNMGLGLNVGASYNYHDKIQFAAGVNDIGYINWNDKLKTYSSPNVKIDFEGLDLNTLTGKDSIGVAHIIDSVKSIFKLNETTNQAYKTTLPLQFYIMGNYHLTKRHAVGATLSAAGFNQNIIPTFTACYQFTPNKHFNAALSYTAKTRAAFNIGAAAMVRGAGMQWYVVSDNIINIFRPTYAKNANIAFGANIAIGYVNRKYLKKEKKDDDKDKNVSYKKLNTSPQNNVADSTKIK